MRRTHLAIAAVGLSAVAVTGSAFTAANSYTGTSNVAGYVGVTATGATITNIAYTTLSSDASKLSRVVFTSSTDVTGKTARMTLRNAGTVVGTPYSCVLGAYATTMSITCDTPDNPGVETFDTVGLTITQ